MELIRYWSRRKWLAITALIIGVGTVAIAIMLLSGFARLSQWLVSTWPAVGTAEKIQILTFSVNGALTLILVGATCLYAWLTWRMVRGLEESRRLSKRPRLVIELGSFVVATPEGAEGMSLKCPFRITNVGVGPAVHPQGEIMVPHESPRTEGDEWLLKGIRTTLAPVPPILDVGKDASGTAELFVKAYQIPAGRTREFASITLKFQDVEGNLFQQTLTFNVFRHDARYYVSLAYERLAMTPYTNRWLGDNKVAGRILPDRATVIYERASFI